MTVQHFLSKDIYCNDPLFWNNMEGAAIDSCWIPTTKNETEKGYKQVKRHGAPQRAHVYAYQISWLNNTKDQFDFNFRKELVKKCEVICHSCDNPPCCSPFHIYRGSQGQNIREAVLKGNMHKQKLTVKDVKYIREQLCNCSAKAHGELVINLAVKFKVRMQTIYEIENRRTWWYI